MRKLLVVAAAWPLACIAEPHEEQTARAIQRALIQLDQHTVDFARGTPPSSMPADADRPPHVDPVIAREWRPFERMRAAQGSVLRLPPPDAHTAEKPERPLPLPGGPRHGVEPVPATGLGG